MKSLVRGSVIALILVAVSFPLEARDDRTDPLRRTQSRAQVHESLLAALGQATVDCLGTVSPRSYQVNSAGVLERTFEACNARDGRTLEQIDQLLGVQHAREAQDERLAERFARTWSAAARRFPAKLIRECPSWELLHVIDAPTRERVAYFAAQEGAASIGKEYHWYKVSSAQCGASGACAVAQAKLCGAGFSDQFIVWTDPTSSSVIVDPLWWTTPDGYEDEENPFMSHGAYSHPMSYYGELPGALYGSLARAGESCSKWSETAQKHYHDRKLAPIDCGGGWACMTICK